MSAGISDIAGSVLTQCCYQKDLDDLESEVGVLDRELNGTFSRVAAELGHCAQYYGQQCHEHRKQDNGEKA